MFGVGRDLCGSFSPTPCRSRVTQSRLHSTAARQVWNISREGDSTASLGSLFQGSVTLRGKKFFLEPLFRSVKGKASQPFETLRKCLLLALQCWDVPLRLTLLRVFQWIYEHKITFLMLLLRN